MKIVRFGLAPILKFIRREIYEEFKRPTNAFAVLFYLICSNFILALFTKGNLESNLWGALYWILMMFISFSVMNKHLHPDELRKWNYYYLLVHPIQFIAARIIFYALFLWILGFAHFVLLSLWVQNPLKSYDVFFLAIFLGGIGLSSALSLIGAIAVQSNHPTMLMAVLGFPIVIPLLWALIKMTNLSIAGFSVSDALQYLYFLGSMSLINLLLSFIFFPIIWRE